ncbi:dynein regulatory complex subunit 7 [Lampris incognitus]|uniref:dynein regulatory complex subunit 7 n=1 Tax=Lampris incognitus TaxID=2546036 RepID=UPI0024B585FF|nr:dynein regulatory complex subunit 7 [Lampris incognitus]
METLSISESEEKEVREEGEDDGNAKPAELEEILCNIHVAEIPEVPHHSWTKDVDLSQCPTSYKVNSTQEIRLLAITDNFCSQYAHIYPDHKPLLLCPLNECGINKFVSTTLRPTMLPHSELYSWEGCASFVADYLVLEPLEPPVDLPRYLFSPTFTLQIRRGTCFDFATLLCSLLLGAGFNSYCVNGYAVEEMCLLNQRLDECPLLATEVKDIKEEQRPNVKKYAVKPSTALYSRFDRSQEEAKQKKAQAASLKKQLEAQQLQEKSERPPPDPLRGLRVHCWLLVMSGSRGVPQHFFIDPLTGKSYSTTDENFLGIESIWNQHNYWVNIQDCSYSCANMVYDLEDAGMWESVLYDTANQMLLLSSTMKGEPGLALTDEEEEEAEEPQVFEMPQSWVSMITLSKQEMESRWPGGVKVTQYCQAKLERFAPYLLPDGLVTQLTTYQDLECTEVTMVKEWYQHRHDHLQERQLNKSTNVTTEYFRPGHSFHLQSHRYRTMIPETMREMEFYSNARADGLVQRLELPGEMTETFQDRDDFLYCRHVVFGHSVQVFGQRENHEAGNRLLQKVVEHFHRNRSKPASKDVAERAFILTENRIEVIYHLEDDCIIPASRNFLKLQESPGTLRTENFSPRMVSSFQADPMAKPCKNLDLYKMLVALMKEEEKVVLRIKDSDREVRGILASREQEESSFEPYVSIYDTARHERARLHEENTQHVPAEERRCEEEKQDSLAPFLVQLGNPETLTPAHAAQLYRDCLACFKHRLVKRANLIQTQYEKEIQKLQQKQQWYQQNQLTMTNDEEDEYLAYCSETMFRIRVLNLHLTRHKNSAPRKYLSLDEQLKRDPRLAPHLVS